MTPSKLFNVQVLSGKAKFELLCQSLGKVSLSRHPRRCTSSNRKPCVATKQVAVASTASQLLARINVVELER